MPDDDLAVILNRYHHLAVDSNSTLFELVLTLDDCGEQRKEHMLYRTVESAREVGLGAYTHCQAVLTYEVRAVTLRRSLPIAA